MKISDDIYKHGNILWNYHKKLETLEKSDFILALGNNDLRTAEHASKLFLEGYANLIVMSGGLVKLVEEMWSMSEAEKFREVAIGLGVPEESIICETNATNTGENFLLTKKLFEDKGIKPSTGIIVTKPYMCRRGYATGAKQWPEVKWQVSSANIEFTNYPNKDISFERMMNLMVGDLQRIKLYPKQGFQIEQDIPDEVWESYNYLKDSGFDRFVIK